MKCKKHIKCVERKYAHANSNPNLQDSRNDAISNFIR